MHMVKIAPTLLCAAGTLLLFSLPVNALAPQGAVVQACADTH
jgi:hypothetical protein